MSQKPRILILSTAYLPLIGGSELAIHHIAERSPEYDFDVVTGHYDASVKIMETVGRVRVFRAGGRWARISLLLPKTLLPVAIAITALRLMRAHRYIAVHAYQVSQAAGAAWLLKLFHPRIPLVVTIQEGKDLQRQPRLVRTMRSIILRRADVITAISEHLATYVRRYSSSPVVIIPNGVDVTAMSLPHVAREPHTVVTVSRLVEKNNVANLIRAMAHVRTRIPDATLTVIGKGPLREDLVALAADIELAGSVQFAGEVAPENLAVALSSSEVFARPSLSEGLGSAFLEAMAARVPVVASAVGGIPDIVHDMETGLLCDPNHPQDIANAIIRLMTDTELREHIIATAYDMVRTRYDWSMIAGSMGRVYSGLIR